MVPSMGFSIETGSALTVLVASNVGMPLSTTHCKVGAIVAVGQAFSSEPVEWGMFRTIVIAWCVTIPAAAAVSALLFLGMRHAV